MKRRAFLAGSGATLAGVTAGCLDSVPGIGLDTDFEEVDPEHDPEEPPHVTVDGDTVIAQGTVSYGSTDCADVELAYAEYESSQGRLDLLVTGGDEWSLSGGCNDAVGNSGYRVEATHDDGFRYVSVTEHQLHGETYSTTREV